MPEVNINVRSNLIPKGYDPIAFRPPFAAETYADELGHVLTAATDHSFPRLIVRKKPPTYREPDPRDVGRTIEVRRSGEEKWETQNLLAILPEDQNIRFVATNQRGWCGYVDARVRVED